MNVHYDSSLSYRTVLGRSYFYEINFIIRVEPCLSTTMSPMKKFGFCLNSHNKRNLNQKKKKDNQINKLVVNKLTFEWDDFS